MRTEGGIIETTPGRVIFNTIVPKELGFLCQCGIKQRLLIVAVILVLDVILTECRSKKSVFDLEARVAWYFQLCQKVLVL